MSTGDFLVRPLAVDDVDKIVEYWACQTAADFHRMGVDSSLISPAAELKEKLRTRVGIDPISSNSYYLVWCYKGEAIGFSFLGDIVIGKTANIHLHMWQKDSRGKGLGSILFCLSVLEFYRIFSLQEMFCEPRSENSMPNRMLKKIGFKVIKSYRGKSSPLTLVSNLNCYEIGSTLARKFLIQANFKDPYPLK